MECRTSKAKLLGLLALTCAMVGASYFCTTLPDTLARGVGWIGVAFFGLGFIAFPIVFFRAGPQVLVNEDGIDDRRLKLGLIPWSDIRALSIGSVNSVKFLCIELVDPEKYLSRLPRWKRALAAANEGMGFPALSIGFSGLSPGLEKVWSYLQTPAIAGRRRV
jgi:hypothetical protein